MTSKYTYKGMDITMDVYDKIQSVVELLALEDGLTFDEAYRAFAGSRVLASLQNPGNLTRWVSPPGPWARGPSGRPACYRRSTRGS